MPAPKTRTKGNPRKAAPKQFADPKANPVIKALIKGRKTSGVTMDYLRLMEGDRSYGQLAARSGYAILENLRGDLKVTGLEPAGKSGTVSGRWQVTEKSIPAATKALDASRAFVKRDQAESKTKGKRPTAKDRVLSGKLAEIAAANPDLAEQGKDMKPARAKKVEVKVTA